MERLKRYGNKLIPRLWLVGGIVGAFFGPTVGRVVAGQVNDPEGYAQDGLIILITFGMAIGGAAIGALVTMAIYKIWGAPEPEEDEALTAE